MPEPKTFDLDEFNAALTDVINEIENLKAVNAKLAEACKEAAHLYDYIAVATGPLSAAAKYGPDFEPPSPEEWEKMCLETRGKLNAALAAAGAKLE